LPLVSMGGSSIVMTFLSLGVVLSISRSLKEVQETEKVNEPVVETKISK
jgi:cell division protein FtsW (lipid II flippase)